MHYPIAIHKDPSSDYGVTVPDLPGCYSAGQTIEEAMVMAREAILCHIEGLMADGEQVPRPQPIEAHVSDPDYAGATWALVQINEHDLPGKAKRINITINERMLEVIDQQARKEHETRSAFLQKAASRYIESAKS